MGRTWQRLCLLLALPSLFACTLGHSFTSLNPGWNISCHNASVGADLPQYALQALQSQGFVSNPLYRDNEISLSWTGNVDWNFSRSFHVAAREWEQQHVDLVVTGLDTVADVYVNQRLAGSTRNAFRSHRIPVSRLLTEGKNLLQITIHSARKYAQQQADAYPYDLDFPHSYNFIRKPGSDFGWDWGPGFAPAGIYGGVELHAYSAAYLTGATASQEHYANGSILLDFHAVLQCASAGESGILSVKGEHTWQGELQYTCGAPGEQAASLQVLITDLPAADLWYPSGYGSQPLHTFTLTYTPADPSTGNASSLQRRVGFRHLELVREPLRNASGQSFFFRINGVPIFAKGANVIPLDIFHSTRTQERMRAMLRDAKAVHMNMLRLWGGGLPYFTDEFYDLCDEQGILIWQEATFACALYPRDRHFLTEVEEEVKYQALRISHHTSLAIWGGNNEVEQVLEGYGQRNPRLYAVDYARLFIDVIQPVIRHLAPHTPFVDTSPSSGILSSDPYVKSWKPTQDTTVGDVHFYDYVNNCLDLTKLPRAKFVSEYGVLSYASFGLLSTQTAPEDWSYASPMSDFRMRHPDGNEQLLAQLRLHFRVPPPTTDTNSSTAQAKLFNSYIYLTQVQQAMCYDAAISYWRRIKSEPDAATMGVLYWQMNDIWAGPSWSTRDHDNHWKPAHYAARHFFAPVLASAEYSPEEGLVHVWVTSDVPQPLSGELCVSTVPWGYTSDAPDRRAPATLTFNFSLAPFESRLVTSQGLQYLKELAGCPDGCDTREFFLMLNAEAEVVPSNSNSRGPSRSWWSGWHAEQQDEKVQIKGVGADDVGLNDSTWVGTLYNSRLYVPQPAHTELSAAGDQKFVSKTPVWLTEFKDAHVPTNPRLRIDGVSQMTSHSISFQVSCQEVGVMVYIDAWPLLGTCSDNLFACMPEHSYPITFDSEHNVDAHEFSRVMTVTSLADTLQNERQLYSQQ